MEANTTDIIEKVRLGKSDYVGHVQISSLGTSDEIQVRDQLDPARVQTYLERIEAGEEPPAGIVIESEDGTRWLCDAFHRREALLQHGRNEIVVAVYKGTLEDAAVVSGWANANHGLELKDGEKREYIRRVRKHPSYRSLSAREVARRFSVSHKLVNSVDHELSGTEFQIPTKRQVKRGDQSYEIDTKRRPDEQAEGIPAGSVYEQATEDEHPSEAEVAVEVSDEKPSQPSADASPAPVEVEQSVTASSAPDLASHYHQLQSALDSVDHLLGLTISPSGEAVIPAETWEPVASAARQTISLRLDELQRTPDVPTVTSPPLVPCPSQRSWPDPAQPDPDATFSFSHSKNELAQGIRLVTQRLRWRRPYRLPAGLIRIALEGDVLSVVATNGEVTAKWTSKCKASSGTGVATVYAEAIAPILKHKKEDDLIFCQVIRNYMQLRSGTAKIECPSTIADVIQCPPSVECSLRPNFNTTEPFKKLLHTMSWDVSKPKMLGMALTSSSRGFAVQSISPTRVSRYIGKFSSDSKVADPIRIPCTVALMASHLNLVGIGVDDHFAHFEFENISVFARRSFDPVITVESAFSGKYEQTSMCEVSRSDLLNSLRGTKAKVILRGHQNTITVSLDSVSGRQEEFISCACTDFEAKVSGRYLDELLRSINSESVILKFTEKYVSYSDGDGYEWVSSLYV